MKGTDKTTSTLSSRKGGFTLLEMIVVIGIIGLILGAAAAVIGTGDKSAKITMTDTAVRGVETKLREYRLLGGVYPSQAQGLDALVTKPSIAPVPKRYTQLYEVVPPDAWGNQFKYVFPGSKDPSKPEIISPGPDGAFGTDDDISSQD